MSNYQDTGTTETGGLGSPGRDIGDLDIRDFDAWCDRVGQTVEEHGFAHAWGHHLSEIFHFRRSGPSADSLLRDTLYAWMMKDAQLRAHFEHLSEEQAQQLDRFLANEEGARKPWESHNHHEFLGWLRNLLRDQAEDLEQVREGDGTPVKCLHNVVFQNWGWTVENIPSITCIPKTKVGICNLVKWAAANQKSVRVSGYRHTWTDLYSDTDQVLISLLPLDDVECLPAPEPGIDPSDQLQGIEIVGQIEEGGVTKALCRIGAATTNEQFRRWCLDTQGGNWNWSIPLNVIMVEITWGGSNGPICHGSGWRQQTLSDLVTEIEFVNARGELQLVNDPQQLKVAAGCFGLLGVVTSLTLKLDPMTYAVMKPTKPRVGLTIPPPDGFKIPASIDMSGITQQDMAQAWQDFVDHCENDYYSEWFWFSYQPKCWVNTWRNNGKREDASDSPGAIGTFFEEMEEYLGQVANTTLFKLLPGRWQAELLARGAMVALPEDQTLVTPLIDALHFRRGIQNMRVLDMELEIPIPPRADDPSQPDWTVCQRAWWAVLANIYNRDDAPMRITLEMRIMADSHVTMAPQYGNRFGTCSIEVLTNLNVSQEEWLAFMQEIAEAWDSYTDSYGNRLNVRPHWAKLWQGLQFRGLSVNDYLKNVAYKDRIPEFKAGLQVIADAGGYTLTDLQHMFSNPLLKDIFVEVFR